MSLLDVSTRRAVDRWRSLAVAAVMLMGCARGNTLLDGGGNGEGGGDGAGGSGPGPSGGQSCASITCDPNATCADAGGSPLCTCDAGFEGDGATCADVDECAGDPCGNGTCTNAAGSYSCVCDPGYEEQGGTCVGVDGCAGVRCAMGCTCDDGGGPALCECTITHSTSEAITPANSVSCNSMGPPMEHAENFYYRVFDLAGLGITGDFTVESVRIGIEQAVSNGGSQPANVRLHKLTGALTVQNLSQISATPISVLDSPSPAVVDFAVSGTAMAGSQLVVELHTPNGQGLGNLIFVGSNASIETGPTYLRAPTCMIQEPVTTAAAGFPDMHWVLSVIGTYPPG